MLNGKLIKLYTTSILSDISINNPFEKIADGLNDLNESFHSIIGFFSKVGDFFKELSYWISHPVEVIHAFQPWIIILLISLLVLKLLGFKTDKWLSLFFLLFIIILVF